MKALMYLNLEPSPYPFWECGWKCGYDSNPNTVGSCIDQIHQDMFLYFGV